MPKSGIALGEFPSEKSIVCESQIWIELAALNRITQYISASTAERFLFKLDRVPFFFFYPGISTAFTCIKNIKNMFINITFPLAKCISFSTCRLGHMYYLRRHLFQRFWLKIMIYYNDKFFLGHSKWHIYESIRNGSCFSPVSISYKLYLCLIRFWLK